VDVVVIGDGIIGLSTTFELARAGATVLLVGAQREGVASTAAAGLLAPLVGTLPHDVRPFFEASLDKFPAFVDRLTEYDPTLHIVRGMIEVRGNADTVPSSAKALTRQELDAIQPGLNAPRGALLHPSDGAVDNVRLVAALRKAVSVEPRVRRVHEPVTRVDAGDDHVTVFLRDGTTVVASWAVLAAGAWSSEVAGLPRALPVAPLKGQMLSLDSRDVRYPIMGDVYLVPRHNELAVGATVEHAGFDLSLDDEALGRLRASAIAMVPALRDAPVLRRWSGIRPVTPDLLPIIGPDRDAPRLVYACGHGKNGILLAPETASVVASLVGGGQPNVSTAPFAIDRFATTAKS
jgi:glycine/D-amino acid oxidase-like deaminating enzyme